MKIKLKNLVFNKTLLAARKIDWFTITKYRQAYRNGKDLGTIIINRVTKEIISGNHRVTAMLKEYGPKHVITVSARKFNSQTEILELFIRENVSHGLPLKYYSRNILTRMLFEEGVSQKKTAQIFGASISNVVEWAGETVIVRDGTKTRIEIKKSGLKNVTDMTVQQHKVHMNQDMAGPIIHNINQLIRWCKNNWFDTEDKKLMKHVEILRDLFTDLLDKESSIAPTPQMKGGPFIMTK